MRTLTDAYRAVSSDEAMDFPCPRCGKPRGVMCGYTTAQPSWNRQLGDEMQVCHPRRKDLVRAARQRAYLREMREAARGQVIPATRAQHEIHAALLDFDRREYIALRDWLREHGHILWEAA